MSFRRKIFFFLIVLEFLVIMVIGFYLYKRNKKITAITRIDKNDVLFSSIKNGNLFWEPKPNTKERVNEWIANIEDYVITINSDSFNERFDYVVAKPQKTYRIITLGDSFTYGLYTNTSSNWTEILEDQLNFLCTQNNFVSKFEVINLGVYGYDIVYSLERFKLRGQKYNSDLVVWFLKDDDFMQLNAIMINKERDYSKKLNETGEFKKLVEKGDLYPSWRMAMEETYKQIGEEKLLQTQIFFLNKFVNIYNDKILFLTFPSTRDKYKDVMSQLTESYKNIFFTDKITEINNFEELHFKNDGHPNNKGHKKIAEDLFSYLITNSIIPCKLKK